MWVYREQPVIDDFSNGIPNKFTKAIAVTGLSGFPKPGFAVDGEGDFYVRHTLGEDQIGRISKVSPTGHVVSEEVDKEKSTAVAVEQTNNDALIDNITSIGVFNPEGKELERLGEEGGAKHLVEGAGVGVNAVAGSLFVADASTDSVVVFTQVLPSVPTVEGESVTAITATSATLEGELNPRSEANHVPAEASTEYRFEYGACISATTCSTSPYGAETPAGFLSPSFNPEAVDAPLTGLRSSTTYHYRLLGKNSLGEGAPGTEASFTTQGAGGELVLPDNRGWELVSPPNKQGALIEPIGEFGVVQAAASGSGITYLANAPTEAGPQGNANEVQVLSSRGAGAWSSRDIAIAHTAATGLAVGPGPEYKFFDPELTLSAVQPFGPFNPELSAQASESTAYLHDLTIPAEACVPASSCYVPLVTRANDTANPFQPFGEEKRCTPNEIPREKTTDCGPQFLGATEDLSHVVLGATAELKPGAGAGQLYEWAGGQLEEVSVLPDKEAASEAQARLGFENAVTRGAISASGTRIVWEVRFPGELYLRDMERGETVQLDQAEAKCEAEPGPEKCTSGGGHFQFANTKGTRVFFTDTNRLTENSGAHTRHGDLKADLYECKIVVEGGKLACKLEDLTPKTVTEEGAAVQGSVLGASEDGETVYFVADGVLSSQPNAHGEYAEPGSCEVLESSACNLYVRRGASTSFIARLSGADGHDWSEELGGQPTRVTADGGFLELMSSRSLTGYDNRDVASGRPTAEVYLYDAASGRLSCASCDPTGERPVGVEYKKLALGSGLVGGSNIWPAEALVAANVPGWPGIGLEAAKVQARHQPRYLSNEGRLFFNTVNALVPQDSNGTQDVYQYELPQTEGGQSSDNCTTASTTYSSVSGGCVSLISSGSSAQESAFMDASVSGDDVFFLTSAKLSPLDVDNARDIYDAHVCTGAEPCITYSTTQSPPCTTAASCKPSPYPQPSIFGSPTSQTFQGPASVAPAAMVKPKSAAQLRAEKLSKALKACHAKQNKKRRKYAQASS